MTRQTLVALGVAVCAAGLVAQGQGGADLLLLNGRVYTVDPAKPWAEAVAIRGDRILAVGTTADIKGLGRQGARTIELKGAFVSPGFIDAHGHIDCTGSLLVGVNLLEVHVA